MTQAAPSEHRVDLHLSADESQRGGEYEAVGATIRGAATTFESFRIAVPPGIANGTTLRLPGAGHDLRGDVVVTVRVAQKDASCELRVSPTELRDGCEAEVSPRPGLRVPVEVPAGTQDGMVLVLRGAGNKLPDGTLGDLYVTVWSDPRLAPLARKKRPFRWRERAVDLFFLALGVYGFVAGFAFPLSEVGNPIVFIDGRFFVLGFLGLAIPVVINLPSAMKPLRGRGLGVALLASALVLAGVGLLTVLLIRTIEGFGYHLKF